MEQNVIEQVFGKDVFNDEVMKEKLPKDVYKSWKKTLENGEDLNQDISNSRRSCHERVGFRARRYSLYTLVSANDRYYSREA